jgi:hypothetical protein
MTLVDPSGVLGTYQFQLHESNEYEKVLDRAGHSLGLYWGQLC